MCLYDMANEAIFFSDKNINQTKTGGFNCFSTYTLQNFHSTICVSIFHLLQLIQIPWQQLKANFVPPLAISAYNENCICSASGWAYIDRRRENGANSINEWSATKLWWSSRFLPPTPIEQLRATRPLNAKHKWRWILIPTEHYDLSLLSLVLNQPITVHCNHTAIFQSMPIW